MDLPLLLAGPILRRVEPTLASVWLALSEPCDVRLQTWEGRAETGRPTPLVESPLTPTLRVGVKLHLVEVTAQIPDTGGTSFQPDTIYSYDVQITRQGATTPETLNTLHLLEEGIFDGFPRLPLGFEPGLLPSFAPPPSELTDLSLLYGSCRRPLHRDPDALAMVDDLIFGDNRYQDPRARPHQLFLGGDQIYADDVSVIHMPTVINVGVDLIGIQPDVQLRDPVERLPVDEVAVRTIADPDDVDPETPWLAYQRSSAVSEEDHLIPADRGHWPEGRRLRSTLVDAQLTSTDGDSHLLSLGDFAALYLSVWSPAVWGETVIGAGWAPDSSKPQQQEPLRWDRKLPLLVKGDPLTGAIVRTTEEFPETVAGHLYDAPSKPPKPKTPDERVEAEFQRQKSLRKAFAVHAEFRRNLPKVQRALANVSTYMILDDHDVTDDYFLNPIWRRRVLGKRLGRAILGNAMIAYALFQDWGNDPLAYRTGPKAELLTHVRGLFPEGLTQGPAAEPFAAIEKLLTHDVRELTQTPDRRFGETRPKLTWHFTVDGPRHRAIALDNRTRRSYAGQNGPPGNVSIDAMVDQVPLPPLPAGREVLVVVAPLQVIGPPVLDEVVAPLSYRIFDAVGAISGSELTDASSPTGLREMTGTNPDAIEAWAFDAPTFEHLLERLEPYRQVVILSGDVHYSSGTVMSYWKGGTIAPSRFAQFTSSGLKNVMPSMITFVDPALGLAQQLVRLNLGTERIAWKETADDLVLLPVGSGFEELKPVMKSRLKNVPVMVPPWGWPDLNDPDEEFDANLTTRLNPDRPPDWRWRVTALVDQRPESDRPAGIALLDLGPDAEELLAKPSTVFEGYQRVAARHQHALNRLRNARQILFRANVGRVSFETPVEGALDAVHEVITTFSDPDQPAAIDPVPEVFLRQVASIALKIEAPPSRLRPKAIEARPPDPPDPPAPPGGP